MRTPPRAFTLIELLVVMTIIVVLLALLTPALDRAVYSAELATCAARQDAAASGVITYAMSYKRYYPHRAGPDEVNWLPPYVYSNDRDDRPAIFEAIHPGLLLDPFSGKIDLTTTSMFRQVIYANYNMYFGWRFKPTGGNGKHVDREKGMYRMGDRFTWTDTDGDAPVQRSFKLIVSDFNVVREPDTEAGTTASQALGGHPDRDQQTMGFISSQDNVENAAFYPLQGQTLTVSYWRNQNTATPRPKRGLYDTNHAYDDGSVAQIRDLAWDEKERAVFIPEASNGHYQQSWGQQVPRP